jgi:metal-sulfur cluster biosynthetic enzyme
VDDLRAHRDIDRAERSADRGPEPRGLGAAVKGEPVTEEKVSEEKKTTPVVAEAEKQEKILNALQSVLDPEIGLSVIDLDLIREVVFTPEEAEIKMVLTTPFCPYGPMLINQIQAASETAAEMPVKVTVLPDRWEAPPWLR